MLHSIMDIKIIYCGFQVFLRYLQTQLNAIVYAEKRRKHVLFNLSHDSVINRAYTISLYKQEVLN